jgi:hypothetical protein
LKLKATDTLVVDSIQLKSNYFTTFSKNGSYPIVLNTNDSVLIEITVSYNHTNLPYYFKKIDHYVYSHNNTDTSFHLSAANIYFTPYGTTEVWNMIDFYELPRIWEVQDSIEPTRVYIDRDSIITSNLELLDSIHEAWEEDFQEVRYAGLPYAIQMKAIHPDTLAMFMFQDSTENDSFVNPASLTFTFAKRFKGRIRGRLTSNYTNDLGVAIERIPLSGIRVKVKSKGSNITLTKGYTRDDGTFDLSYNIISFLDGNQIEMLLQFETNNEKFDFKVKRKGAAFDDNPYQLNRNLPSQGANADIENFDVHLLNEQSYPFRIASWTNFAYRFFENSASSYLPSNNLKIKLFGDGSFYRGSKTEIHLEELDERHETVLWHEFGHYVMDKIQLNSLEFQGGVHTFESENNIHVAWSEGWATGFMSMLDVI